MTNKSKLPRHGPQPLALHLGLAAPLLREPGGVDLWRAMIKGIRKYQTHRFERPASARPCVWRAGCIRLYAAKVPDKSTRPPILLVPSLINGSSVLDLLPEKSFMQFLSNSGWPVYLLDWGHLKKDPSYQTLEGVIYSGLIPALEFLQARHGLRPSAIGYCMGGTILTAAAQALGDAIGPCVYLATPWDFQVRGGGLFPLVKMQAFQIRANLAIADYVPAEFLQSLFAAVDPSLSAKKFSSFMRMKRGSASEKLFIAVEDWVNDGRDLPTSIAKVAFEDWYLGNQPFLGKWQLGGRDIILQKIKAASLIVSPKKDKLVPAQSSAPMATLIPKAKIFSPDCGHLGLMASEGSEAMVWKPIEVWLKRQCAAPRKSLVLAKKPRKQ